MRPWARWLIAHRMRWVVLLAVPLVQFPIYIVCCMAKAVLEAAAEARLDWKNILKEAA